MESDSENRLSVLLDTLLQGVQENDCDGVITYSNPAHHAILGYDLGELIGRNIRETLPTEQEMKSFEAFFATLKSTQPPPTPFESSNRRKDGSLVDVRVDWNYVRDARGKLTGFISIITDITEQKRKENSLKRHARGLASLIEVSTRLVGTLDLDEILQAAVDRVTRLADLDTAAVYLLEGEYLHLRATTPPLPPQFPDELRVAPLVDHPHIRETIVTSEPILVLDVTEADLTPSERLVVKQRDLRTLAYLPLVAETEVMGALIMGSVGRTSPVSNEDIELSQTLINIAALAVKNARLYQTGQKYAEDLQHTLVERRRAEKERETLREQLLHAQKMDAIGKLAGGVAHDFNNQLSGILGYAEILHNKLGEERLRRITENIMTAAERSADLTAQLLAFSRKGNIQNAAVDLHEIIEEVESMLLRTINRKIVIVKKLEACPCTTQGDPSQIQNALLNLSLNARDAMPEGGEMTIQTQNVNLETNYCKEHLFSLDPGPYIQVSVTDSGVGMDAATIDRMYEPFFTTKKPGQGTGLGLSAVYGTMKTHKGGISVYSEPGAGSTFKLFFPLKRHADTDIADETSMTGGEAVDSHSASKAISQILVVDDEEAVGHVAAEHLGQAGYLVHLYTDSESALSFFNDNHRSISLVVLDLIMPKMDGRELYRSMKAIDQDVRVILSSGFSINGSAQALLDDGVLEFIQKPFRRAVLLRAVKRALDK